jgi:ABC-type glycerol-3-phosphate transport system permease component
MLPLITPLLGTCLIFGFVIEWNQDVPPSIVSPDQSLHTLPVALRNIRAGLGMYYNGVPMWMAGAVITMVPSVIVYALLQGFFIEDLSRDAVKE